MSYPFNMGDLRDSYFVLKNYMESNSGSSKVPFEDIIYIFGEERHSRAVAAFRRSAVTARANSHWSG